MKVLPLRQVLDNSLWQKQREGHGIEPSRGRSKERNVFIGTIKTQWERYAKVFHPNFTKTSFNNF